MIISKCICFHFFEILIHFWVIPFFSFFSIFFIPRLWAYRWRQSMYQIKAMNYFIFMCIEWLYWPNCDVIKWCHKFETLDWYLISYINLSYIIIAYAFILQVNSQKPMALQTNTTPSCSGNRHPQINRTVSTLDA